MQDLLAKGVLLRHKKSSSQKEELSSYHVGSHIIALKALFALLSCHRFDEFLIIVCP